MNLPHAGLAGSAAGGDNTPVKPSDFLQLIALSAIWGASFLFTRIAVPALGPAWLVTARVLSGALFLAATAYFLRRALQACGNLQHFLVLGVLNTALPFLLFAFAAQSLSASLLSIFNSTAPLWGAVIGIGLSRQLPAGRTLLGLLAGCAGVSLLVLKDASAAASLADGSLLPVLAAIGAPLCYGLASHYARTQTAHLEPLAVAHGSMWGATICLLPTLAGAAVPAVPGAGIAAAALALGIVCTGLAYAIYFRLVRDVGATSALTVTFLIPLFGIVWGVLFLDEPFTGATFLGAAIVLCGTALVTGFNPASLLRLRPARL
jgi:drug/metabolite transporter (DMT)-like permease